MARLYEDTQGPHEAPRVNKIQVWGEIKAVLEYHYLATLLDHDNDKVYTACKIMQDVRTRLELSDQETGG